jgi:hypothetical protein
VKVPWPNSGECVICQQTYRRRHGETQEEFGLRETCSRHRCRVRYAQGDVPPRGGIVAPAEVASQSRVYQRLEAVGELSEEMRKRLGI